MQALVAPDIFCRVFAAPGIFFPLLAPVPHLLPGLGPVGRVLWFAERSDATTFRPRGLDLLARRGRLAKPRPQRPLSAANDPRYTTPAQGAQR